MDVTMLGTGAATLNTERQNTSLLLDTGTELMLIDCSGTPLRSVARAGGDVQSLRRVLLTHSHADHVYGLPSLVHMLWLHGGMRPGKSLDIYGPADAVAAARQIVDAFDLTNKKDAVEINYTRLDDRGDTFLEFDGWSAACFTVTHGGFDAIGYSFSNGERRLVYSGDALADEHIDEALAIPSNVVVHDCGGGLKSNPGHAGAEEIAEIVQGREVERLALTHLPQMTDEQVSELISYTQDRVPAVVSVPSDGDSFTV